MRNVMVSIALGAVAVAAALAATAADEAAVIPAKISVVELAGSIFERDDMIETAHEGGNTTLDVTTLLSSDGKFASGMYRSGKTRLEIEDPMAWMNSCISWKAGSG